MRDCIFISNHGIVRKNGLEGYIFWTLIEKNIRVRTGKIFKRTTQKIIDLLGQIQVVQMY